MSDFAARVDAFLGEYFALDPLTATSARDARPRRRMAGDDRRRPSGAARLLRSLDARARRASMSPGSRPTTRIDRDLLLGELAAYRFGETELREDTWSPLEWVYLLGDGLFTLIAREFAPLAERLASVAGRLEGMPAVLDAARTLARLRRPAGRPVSTPRRRSPSGPASPISIGDALAEGERGRGGRRRGRRRGHAPAARGGGRRRDRARRVRAPPARRRAARRRTARGASGSELFAQKLVHTLRSTELTPAADPGPRPARVGCDVRAEMVRIAREIWPAWCGDAAAARRRRRGRSGGSSTRSPSEHPAADDILDFCRAELGRIEAFCRERDVIGLADEPLDIRWTPVFLRSFGGAMLDSPGPLDRGQKAFFSVTPIPEEWTPEQAESYLREDNDRMLQLLTIHEAVPGHYLQGVYAQPRRRRCPDDLLERRLRRGLGGLRDPGDDGRRVRRRRPGAPALPLEVLPAVRRERADRRRDPHRRA